MTFTVLEKQLSRKFEEDKNDIYHINSQNNNYAFTN